MQWITSPLIKSLAVDRKCTIRAVEKLGGLLAPYFASHVSEAALNLADLAESSIAHPLMHVPGTPNPTDRPSRANSKVNYVGQESL